MSPQPSRLSQNATGTAKSALPTWSLVLAVMSLVAMAFGIAFIALALINANNNSDESKLSAIAGFGVLAFIMVAVCYVSLIVSVILGIVALHKRASYDQKGRRKLAIAMILWLVAGVGAAISGFGF